MRTVIVVDDEPAFRKWLKSLLDNSEEFTVIGEASSGYEAIGLVDLQVPDLVISDIYMPDADGFEVVKYITTNHPTVQTILTSVYNEQIYTKLAKEEGAIGFIPKAALSINKLSQLLQEEVV
jgi:YesN/AraC family two-component response regulator